MQLKRFCFVLCTKTCKAQYPQPDANEYFLSFYLFFFNRVHLTDFITILRGLVCLMKLLIWEVFGSCSYFFGSFKKGHSEYQSCLQHFQNSTYNKSESMVIDCCKILCDCWKDLPNGYHDCHYQDITATFIIPLQILLK